MHHLDKMMGLGCDEGCGVGEVLGKFEGDTLGNEVGKFEGKDAGENVVGDSVGNTDRVTCQVLDL